MFAGVLRRAHRFNLSQPGAVPVRRRDSFIRYAALALGSHGANSPGWPRPRRRSVGCHPSAAEPLVGLSCKPDATDRLASRTLVDADDGATVNNVVGLCADVWNITSRRQVHCPLIGFRQIVGTTEQLLQ